MAEIRSGLRHILSVPQVYDLFQRLVGAYAWRKSVIQKNILPSIPENSLIIDIGCGTAEILKYLPSHIEYAGFDRNPNYIDKARTRHTHKNAKFFCEELTADFSLNGRHADVVLAFGLIHHLDDTGSQHLLKIAKQLIGNNGFFLAIDPVFDERQSMLAKYVVSKDRGTAVRTEAEYRDLALKEFSSVETSIDFNPLIIPTTGIVMKCENKY